MLSTSFLPDSITFGSVSVASESTSYAFIFTYVMLFIIDRFTPVRLTEKEEESVDEALHGESAYI